MGISFIVRNSEIDGGYCPVECKKWKKISSNPFPSALFFKLRNIADIFIIDCI